MDENFALRACATRTWPGAVAELELSLSIHNVLGKLGGGGSLLIHTMVQFIAVLVKIAMDFLNFIFFSLFVLCSTWEAIWGSSA